MKMKKLFGCWALLLSLVLVSACASNASTPGFCVTIPPITPTTAHQCTSRLIPVTFEHEDVYRFWWSDDGATLYVMIYGQPETQAVDVVGGAWRPAPGLSYPGDRPLPEDIVDKVPPDVKQSQLALSPGGDGVIYGLWAPPEPTRGPAPTPNLEGIPTDLLLDFTYDIYLARVEDAEPIYLGSIDGQPSSFTWFPDGTRVLIATSVKAPGQAYGWLADLSSRSLSPLFPREGGAPVWFKAISPDGRWILYDNTQEDHLCMKNVMNGQERELALTPPMRVWWLSTGDQFLLLRPDEQDYDEKQFFWYDLRTQELNRASDQTVEIAVGTSILLSPNETQVAFRWQYSRQLFVITLCPSD